MSDPGQPRARDRRVYLDSSERCINLAHDDGLVSLRLRAHGVLLLRERVADSRLHGKALT